MKRIILVVAASLAALIGAPVASAHSFTLTGEADCLQSGQYNVTWQIQNNQGAENPMVVTSSSRSVVPVGTVVSTSISRSETVSGTTGKLSLTLAGRWQSGVVRLVTSDAQGFVGCSPPDESTIDPRARFWGPCGDPFYRAILNNTRSDRAVTFLIGYRPFGESRRTLVRRVGASERKITGLFDVAGRTRMTIHFLTQPPRARILIRSQMSAPNRVYKPCPSGVPVIGS